MTREGWDLGRYRDFLKAQVPLLTLDARLNRRLSPTSNGPWTRPRGGAPATPPGAGTVADPPRPLPRQWREGADTAEL